MKKEEITALGITEEQAAKVLELHEKEQNAASAKLSEAETKLAAAQSSVKELTEKVKAFDGVDVEALKKAAADWETKYNADIAKAKIDSAVEIALTKAGAKDVALAKHLIDTSIIKFDGDKLIGLEEQLTKAKTDKAFLFGESPAATPMKAELGAQHREPAPEATAAETLSSALNAHYGTKNV